MAPAEAPFVPMDGFVAGVMKKWKPAPPPPIRMKSAEFSQDLQEPGILEKGQGGNEGRRATGELLPGQLQPHRIEDLAEVPDFLAKKDPNIVLGSAKFGGREPPVIRMDRNNSFDSDDAPGFSAPPPPPSRNHSASISQMPPKTPGGPRVRIEKPKFSDDEDSDDNWVPPRPPPVDAVSQMPPKTEGGPQIRIERNSAPDDFDDNASDVSGLSDD